MAGIGNSTPALFVKRLLIALSCYLSSDRETKQENMYQSWLWKRRGQLIHLGMARKANCFSNSFRWRPSHCPKYNMHTCAICYSKRIIVTVSLCTHINKDSIYRYWKCVRKREFACLFLMIFSSIYHILGDMTWNTCSSQLAYTISLIEVIDMIIYSFR